MNKYNVRMVAIVATVIFISSFMLIPWSPLRSSFYSTVYAANLNIKCVSGISCNGTSGDDVMKGDKGPNAMAGFGGNDRMSGGGDEDVLNGGDGDDTLSGGDGNDGFIGSSGADFFKCGSGIDTITDFNEGEGDTKSSDCEIVQ